MVFVYFFFFKQKTAYEMRISDWSSDVCSSDLLLDRAALLGSRLRDRGGAPAAPYRAGDEPAQAVGGSFRRQSGVGRGAPQARLSSDRQGRATLQPRARRRSGVRPGRGRRCRCPSNGRASGGGKGG